MKENNAVCKICGEPYHCCLNCDKNKDNFASYKLFACSHNCFKIYATVTSGDSKEDQIKALKDMDLSKLETFEESVKDYIKDLFASEVKEEVKTIVKEEITETIVEPKKAFKK